MVCWLVSLLTTLECANLLALWYFYQSDDKSPHSKVASYLLMIGSSIIESARLFRCTAIAGVPSAGMRMKVSLS